MTLAIHPSLRALGASILYPSVFFGAFLALGLARGAPSAIGAVLLGSALLVSILEEKDPTDVDAKSLKFLRRARVAFAPSELRGLP